MNAVIGVGTNIGNRLKNIKEAIASLNLLPETKVIKTSYIYETEPWGYENQDCFLNCVVEIETQLSPQAVLGACLGIEAGFGRVRAIKNGPRILDLDLLVYEDISLNTNELKLPHPGILSRAFVLYPLKDIFPDMNVYNLNLSAEYENCDSSTVSFFAEI